MPSEATLSVTHPLELDNAELPIEPEARLLPFLRWAGGKRWLVPQVLDLVGGASVARYHEPFVGGASVFLALNVTHAAHLSDLNEDLIDVYRQVRDRPSEVAARLDDYENTAEDYYDVRATVPADPVQRAARFIYLNHTSYNGIFRVNLKGKYNVPFGYRKSINIPNEKWLVGASARLQGAELSVADFEVALSSVQEGDFVFLDPPYTIAHNNNGFVKYNQQLFSFEDQRRLATVVRWIDEIGAHFVLTNAAHKSIDELFSPLGRRLIVSRRNAIGGKQATRGRADEYLFTNLGAQ